MTPTTVNPISAAPQAIFERLSEGYALHELVTNSDGKPIDLIYRQVNSAFKTLIGVDVDIIGKRVSEIVPKLLAPNWIVFFEDTLVKGEEKIFEHYAQHSRRWYRGRAFRLEKNFFSLLLTDITVEKNSEEHLLALISSLDDIIFELDQSMRFLNVWSSPLTKESALYFNPQTFLGRDVIQVFGPEHGQMLAKKLKSVFKTGNIENFEYTGLIPGDTRWWNAKIAPVVDETNVHHKTANKLVCVISDITQRKTIDRALRESEERYRCLIELSPDGIVVYQKEKTVFANATFLRLIKAESLDKVLHRSIFDFIPPTQQAAVRERKKNRSAESKSLFCIEETLQCLDGSTLPVEISGLPVMFHGEDAVQIIIRDISLRKRETEEKVKLQARLHHSSKLASLGTLAAGVAHEINNPLAILIGNNELLYEALQKTQQANLLRFSQSIQDAGFRISGIAQGLNIYARTECETDNNIDLHKVITDTTALVNTIFSKSGIKIELQLNSISPRVSGNTGHYQQVLMNFLTNARDAILKAKASGVIQIQTRETEDDEIELKISDDGCGIESQHMTQIFDPFFTTKPPGKGTGLGLSISHEIITNFGGILKIDSTPNQGTTVTVCLPKSKTSQKREAITLPN